MELFGRAAANAAVFLDLMETRLQISGFPIDLFSAILYNINVSLCVFYIRSEFSYILEIF